ncbi:MAG: hypothetical protein LBE48_06045 [Methanomassiliicoccaceae archaeon]|jgi:hypothetical protein|nr:hypothetical protein [Methanomassiliicoccaceae archaeon]
MKGKYRYISLLTLSVLLAASFALVTLGGMADDPQGCEEGTLGLFENINTKGDEDFELDMNLFVGVVIALIIAIGGTAYFTLKK